MFICTFMCVKVYVCMCIYFYVCECVYECTRVYMFVNVCICTFMCVNCECVCM